MRRSHKAFAALVLLAIFGCVPRTPTRPPDVPAPAAPPPAEKAPPTEKAPPAALPAPPAPPPPSPPPGERAYLSGTAAMADGNYERSLEFFSAAWKENPAHPGVARDFHEAVVRLKKSGDEAMKEGRIEDAGKRWEATIRYMGHPAANKTKPLPFTKTELREATDKVSATLMEKGLVEYRKGNLEAAIGWWKSILAYDPNHAEAARSVQTASTQMENLKKINPPK